jgi:Flagellar capping protein
VITVEVKQVATAARTISDTLDARMTDPNATLASLGLWTGTYSITINGVTITGDASTDSLNTLLHKINTSSAGVTAYYDAANNRISFTAKEAGWVNGPNRDGDRITFDDGGSGFLGTVLGLNSGVNETAAQKAIVTINGLESEQNTNTLTVNGITITLKAVGTATLTVRTDVDAVVAKIKAFVDTYNETLSLVQTKLKEKRYRDYLPLTEEQKKEMTEEQIKLWEEKAKSGLLRGDSVLQALEQSLRSIATAVYSTGSSAVNSLASIGIRSLSYLDNGKLYIDEAKLRQAIETDIEAVKKLFQQDGATEAEKGIAVRLYDRVAQAMKEVTRKAGSDPTCSTAACSAGSCATSMRAFRRGSRSSSTSRTSTTGSSRPWSRPLAATTCRRCSWRSGSAEVRKDEPDHAAVSPTGGADGDAGAAPAHAV